jgi:iron complex outermembrane receptor protein
MRRSALRGAMALAASALGSAVAGAQESLPTIEVVGVSPVAGSEIDINKVPADVLTVGSAAFSHTKTPDLFQAMIQGIPFVSPSDQTGNPFQINLDYRGFTASPVAGTPQGIAVYQNGVRINEAYGDVVNWDLIPEMAINRMTLMPNNPVFGLNAIGGALSIEMKNGFNYHGEEVEVRGGSFGRIGGGAQAGIQNGNYSAYVTADSVHDDGWRDFSSSSQVNRMYVDLGARGDQTEFHLNFTGADNRLGGTVATPLQMLDQRWSAVYTWPQTTHLQVAFLQASASWKPTDTFSMQGIGYYRGFWQGHIDGNGTDSQPCDPGGPFPGQLCIGDGVTPININQPTPNNISPGAFLGEIDRNWTSTNSYGGSLQATSTREVFDRTNHLVVGLSVDHGRSQFTGTSELGTIDQNLFITGVGVFIDQPAADLSPVSLLAQNTYTGIYATDTFDITPLLSVTAGGRFNIADLSLQDETGQSPLLTSSQQYQRLNPVVGLTYKITPNVTAYAGYSEANRAPTPLELGCSDPAHPCMIDNFLISDPPLQQVVSHTYEGGLRGEIGTGGTAPVSAKEKGTNSAKEQGTEATQKPWLLTWSLGVFHTNTTNDIINVASAVVPMFGYFQNAAKTLREGVEAKAAYSWDRWTVSANYTFIDATYQTNLILQSPNNPASADGLIFVIPGDHIPGIPNQRFKLSAEYQITDAWKLGGDLLVFGSQYLIHDDSNQNPKVPPYWVVNLHSSYQVTKNVEVFGLIQNLFDLHYFSAGTFFNTAGFNSNTFGASNFFVLNDPRTFLPGMPFAAYAGVRATF